MKTAFIIYTMIIQNQTKKLKKKQKQNTCMHVLYIYLRQVGVQKLICIFAEFSDDLIPSPLTGLQIFSLFPFRVIRLN